MSGCSTRDGEPGDKHSSKAGGSMDLTHMEPGCGVASQGEDQVWKQWSVSDTVQGSPRKSIATRWVRSSQKAQAGGPGQDWGGRRPGIDVNAAQAGSCSKGSA